MRKFSGDDFTGLRLLMEDELLIVAGGDGEDVDEQPQPVNYQNDYNNTTNRAQLNNWLFGIYQSNSNLIGLGNGYYRIDSPFISVSPNGIYEFHAPGTIFYYENGTVIFSPPSY